MDHVYTSTTCDEFNPVEFTYKLSPKETEDFVKLRVSNDYLFSGRRHSAMRAWRAILKHMGLQHKMTHRQAAKKWVHMKKKYKVLKSPPEGVKVFPEMWPYFTLLDDAMEGRLEGSAPIVKAFPNDKDDTDFLPTSKPKRRKISMMKSTPSALMADAPEIEVLLNSDEEGEGEEEAQGGSKEIQRILQEVESKRQVMQREKQLLERERQVMQREKQLLEREIAALDRDRASLERERVTIEREKAVMEREKAIVEKDRDAVSRDRLALERDRARQARFNAAKERTVEVTEEEDSSNIKDSEVVDRRERFLNLFEKLIENV